MRTKHFVPILDNVDFISGLPDDILGSIISFLPANEAVATSILSRRWRYVFACSPSIDFDFSLFPRTRGQKQAFVDFVNLTLQLFYNPELRKFRLSMEEYIGYVPDFEDWIAFAVANKVQELDLGLPRGRLFKLPDSIFTCESITDLKLRMSNYAFDLPSPIGLKFLKCLEIKSVSLLKGEFFKDLAAGCLALEELVVEQCRIDVLEIESEKLTKLTLCNCDWVIPTRIKVSAPSLRCFTYIGEAASDHCLENLSSLVEVELNLSPPGNATFESDEDKLSYMIKLVQMVGSAKVLTLSSWCIEQLSRALSTPNYGQVQGENVRELVLLLERRDECIRVMPPLLASCPNLESLSVCITPSQFARKGSSSDGGKQREQFLKGAMRRLKNVKLEYIDESRTGLELVKVLLKNAEALERMTIVPSEDGLEHAKFRRRVSMFQRASQSAVVEYSTAA